MVPFFNLTREFIVYKKELNKIIQSVFKRGKYILGEEVRRFETGFSRYLGCAYAAGVASGTDALMIALLAIDIKPGDEVITAVNTAAPTAMAIAAVGAKPVFIDCLPDEYNMNPSLIEEAVTRRTKAIIPVHLYGAPAKMDEIVTIAKKHKLKVIEDCAQAIGTKYKQRKVGTIGELGCFSFYPTKNLGAYGDGGMIVTNSQKYFNKLKMLRNYGESRRYYNEVIGLNSRLDELQAAILNFKLKRLDELNQARISIAGYYNHELSELVEVPKEDTANKHTYHLYVIRSKRRNNLKNYMLKKGIGVDQHYPMPLHRQPVFSKGANGKRRYPVAEANAKTILSLPVFPYMTKAEIKTVAATVKEYFKEKTGMSGKG